MVKFFILLLLFQGISAIIKAKKKADIKRLQRGDSIPKSDSPHTFFDDAKVGLNDFFDDLKVRDGEPLFESKDAVDKEFYEDYIEKDEVDKDLDRKENNNTVYKSKLKSKDEQVYTEWERPIDSSKRSDSVNDETYTKNESSSSFSKKDLQRGIIMSEILSKPVSLR